MAIFMVRVEPRDVTIVDAPVHVAHTLLSRPTARVCAFKTAVEAISFARRVQSRANGPVDIRLVDAEAFLAEDALARGR